MSAYMYDSNNSTIIVDAYGNAQLSPSGQYQVYDASGNVQPASGNVYDISGNLIATQPDNAPAPVSSGGFFSDFFSGFNANQIPQALVQLYQAGRQADVANQLIQLNIQRSQKGLAPITMNQIGGAALLSPQAGVTVGVSSSTQNLIIGGLLLAGGLFVFSKVIK